MDEILRALESRDKGLPGYAYKLAVNQYAMDSYLTDRFYVDEARKAVYIPFASGERRDGVGDLLEIAGIETDRHQANPIVLFDHGKEVSLPIAVAEDPQTKKYTVELDPTAKIGGALSFFYGNSGGEDDPTQKSYEHALFCDQVFDMMAKRFIRGGSIGYTVIEARELFPDYRTGTPAGLHLIRTKMLELSAVILPANQDTVSKSLSVEGVERWLKNRQDTARRILSMPKICGKSPSPYLVKSLLPLAGQKKIRLGVAQQKAEGEHRVGVVNKTPMRENIGYGGVPDHYTDKVDRELQSAGRPSRSGLADTLFTPYEVTHKRPGEVDPHTSDPNYDLENPHDPNPRRQGFRTEAEAQAHASEVAQREREAGNEVYEEPTRVQEKAVPPSHEARELRDSENNRRGQEIRAGGTPSTMETRGGTWVGRPSESGSEHPKRGAPDPETGMSDVMLPRREGQHVSNYGERDYEGNLLDPRYRENSLDEGIETKSEGQRQYRNPLSNSTVPPPRWKPGAGAVKSSAQMKALRLKYRTKSENERPAGTTAGRKPHAQRRPTDSISVGGNNKEKIQHWNNRMLEEGRAAGAPMLTDEELGYNQPDDEYAGVEEDKALPNDTDYTEIEVVDRSDLPQGDKVDRELRNAGESPRFPGSPEAVVNVRRQSGRAVDPSEQRTSTPHDTYEQASRQARRVARDARNQEPVGHRTEVTQRTQEKAMKSDEDMRRHEVVDKRPLRNVYGNHYDKVDMELLGAGEDPRTTRPKDEAQINYRQGKWRYSGSRPNVEGAREEAQRDAQTSADNTGEQVHYSERTQEKSVRRNTKSEPPHSEGGGTDGRMHDELDGDIDLGGFDDLPPPSNADLGRDAEATVRREVRGQGHRIQNPIGGKGMVRRQTKANYRVDPDMEFWPTDMPQPPNGGQPPGQNQPNPNGYTDDGLIELNPEWDSYSGEKSMPEDTSSEDALQITAPEMGSETTEPYGAQLLRRLHEDYSRLLEEYDGLLAPLEQEHVRKLMLKALANKEGVLTNLEKVWGERYKDLPPLQGGMDGEFEEGEIPHAPGETGGDLDGSIDGLDERSMQEEDELSEDELMALEEGAYDDGYDDVSTEAGVVDGDMLMDAEDELHAPEDDYYMEDEPGLTEEEMEYGMPMGVPGQEDYDAQGDFDTMDDAGVPADSGAPLPEPDPEEAYEASRMGPQYPMRGEKSVDEGMQPEDLQVTVDTVDSSGLADTYKDGRYYDKVDRELMAGPQRAQRTWYGRTKKPAQPDRPALPPRSSGRLATVNVSGDETLPEDRRSEGYGSVASAENAADYIADAYRGAGAEVYQPKTRKQDKNIRRRQTKGGTVNEMGEIVTDTPRTSTPAQEGTKNPQPKPRPKSLNYKSLSLRARYRMIDRLQKGLCPMCGFGQCKCGEGCGKGIKAVPGTDDYTPFSQENFGRSDVDHGYSEGKRRSQDHLKNESVAYPVNNQRARVINREIDDYGQEVGITPKNPGSMQAHTLRRGFIAGADATTRHAQGIGTRSDERYDRIEEPPTYMDDGKAMPTDQQVEQMELLGESPDGLGDWDERDQMSLAEACDFLEKIAQEGSLFEDEDRMKSYHFHKLMDGVKAVDPKTSYGSSRNPRMPKEGDSVNFDIGDGVGRQTGSVTRVHQPAIAGNPLGADVQSPDGYNYVFYDEMDYNDPPDPMHQKDMDAAPGEMDSSDGVQEKDMGSADDIHQPARTRRQLRRQDSGGPTSKPTGQSLVTTAEGEYHGTTGRTPSSVPGSHRGRQRNRIQTHIGDAP